MQNQSRVNFQSIDLTDTECEQSHNGVSDVYYERGERRVG